MDRPTQCGHMAGPCKENYLFFFFLQLNCLFKKLKEPKEFILVGEVKVRFRFTHSIYLAVLLIM